MRSAGNFHPEWGYLAPTPSFVRTLRTVLVATAIGATAGAGVVMSLVAHPASGSGDDGSIAVHALVTGAPVVNAASTAIAPAQTAAIPAAAGGAQQAAPSGDIGATGISTANAASAPQVAGAPSAANGAALAQPAQIEEPAVAPVHEDSALLPEAAPSKKTAAKKHRASGYEAFRRWQTTGRGEAKKPRRDDGGFEPLFRLFSSRTGSYSAN